MKHIESECQRRASKKQTANYAKFRRKQFAHNKSGREKANARVLTVARLIKFQMNEKAKSVQKRIHTQSSKGELNIADLDSRTEITGNIAPSFNK